MLQKKDYFLTTRAIIEHGKYALIPPDGLVENRVPPFEDSMINIVASPELGASFVHYLVKVLPSGGTKGALHEEGCELFLYTIEGEGLVKIGARSEVLTPGGYAYAPPSVGMEIRNEGDSPWRFLLHKQVYAPLEDLSPEAIFHHVDELETVYPYESFELVNPTAKNLLPDQLAYDFNFHVLSFASGCSHPFVETHLQEHGLYFLSGQGMYLLNSTWVPVKEGDYIWFGPYTPQVFYCTGQKDAVYVYSKNCNRDVKLT